MHFFVIFNSVLIILLILSFLFSSEAHYNGGETTRLLYQSSTRTSIINKGLLAISDSWVIFGCPILGRPVRNRLEDALVHLIHIIVLWGPLGVCYAGVKGEDLRGCVTPRTNSCFKYRSDRSMSLYLLVWVYAFLSHSYR